MGIFCYDQNPKKSVVVFMVFFLSLVLFLGLLGLVRIGFFLNFWSLIFDVVFLFLWILNSLCVVSDTELCLSFLEWISFFFIR